MRAVFSLALLLLGSLCFAQVDMSDMGKMMSSPVSMMMRPDIKKELKLTKDQDKEISKLLKEMNTGMTGAGQDMTAAVSGMQKYEAANGQVLSTLDDSQKKRLAEIQVQMRGPACLKDPEFASQLSLSDDQVSKITDISDEFSKSVMQELQSRPGKGTMDKLEKMRTERDTKILALLTPDQQAKYKDLQGKPFKNARPKGMVF